MAIDALDPNGRRLELGGARLRIGRIDRQDVGRDVVLKMEGHEGQARPQCRIEAHRHLDAATPRDRPYLLAVFNAQSPPVVRMDVERLAASQGRGIAAGLDSGIKGIQSPSGCQADRELIGEALDRRLVLGHVERRQRTLHRVGPEPPMQERAAGMILGRAGPVQAVELFEA